MSVRDGSAGTGKMPLTVEGMSTEEDFVIAEWRGEAEDPNGL